MAKFDGEIDFGGAYMSNPLPGAMSDDFINFNPWRASDAVNSPSHYTRGKQEAIDIIEEAIQDAPSPKGRYAAGTSSQILAAIVAQR